MIYLKYFIKFVELRTKIISILPFTIALLFYLNNYAQVNGLNIFNFVLFFCSMVCFDMATTAINHCRGLTKEKDTTIYDSEILMKMKQLNFTMKTNYLIVITLICLATFFGLILTFNSNIGVLLLGMLAFLIGISYSFGPKPISCTPFGELFAGGAMGILLPVIVLFSQYDQLPFELNPLLIVVFFPLAFLIGNILLANNICDLEKDISNQRFTLAYYLGKEKAATALLLSNVAAFGFIVISIFLNYLSWTYLLLVVTLPSLTRNVQVFRQKFSKNKSFPLIVKNFVIFSTLFILLLFVNK